MKPIKFILPRFAYPDGRPAADIYIHLDILGDDEVRYQHFRTDAEGRLLSGGKSAMVQEAEYDLCATLNDVHDDIMAGYQSFHTHILEGVVVQIPEDIVVEWEWDDNMEHLKALEGENRKLAHEIEEMERQLANLQARAGDQTLGPADESLDEERAKLQNIYSNIEIAKKKIEENWDLVEKGKAKLKVLLDKQEDTLQFLEMAEKEKEELQTIRQELDGKKRQIDLIFRAIVGSQTGSDSEATVPGEGTIVDDEYMEGFISDPDIDTLRKIREHIHNIKEKREQLEIAREKILEARRQLKDRKDDMTSLTDEMRQTIMEYDALISELQAEKEKLAAVREKLSEGWDRLKEEYVRRARGMEEKYILIEREKALLAEKKEEIRELVESGRERITTERSSLRDQQVKVRGHLLEGTHRLKEEKVQVLDNKHKLAELGKDLRKQSFRIKEAIVAKKAFEERYDTLKDEEKKLEDREMMLRREQRKLERDHTLRMEAYSQNDADIEEEFKALDEMRELIKGQREDLARDRLQFLKESMYYECPVCGGTIPVKSSQRPLRVQCPSCTTEFNLKVKQTYQCPDCNETITVTTSKRPLNVKCQKCASEFIIRKPFKFEEEILPDHLKQKIPAS